MHEDAQVGAGMMLWYLRALFTDTSKEIFTRDELLVMIDTIQKDAELMAPNMAKFLMDAMDEEDEQS
jgi:hypothetical protein